MENNLELEYTWDCNLMNELVKCDNLKNLYSILLVADNDENFY